MALQNAMPPARLWRIGRYPNPFAWPPWEYSGAGRFDDALAEFRTLYAAEQRLACFVETLAPYRADIAWLAKVRALPLDVDDEDGLRDAGQVPDDWHVLRRVGWFELSSGIKALDLRSLGTREVIRSGLAAWLSGHGYRDFDLSDALNRDRDLTQRISRWAYEQGYRAIAYTSRFGTQFDCWVLLGGQQRPDEPIFNPLGLEIVRRNDPDLVEAARLLQLRL